MVNPTQERQLFEQALDLESTADRLSFVHKAAAHDPALRDRLLQLLEAHDQAGRFLNGAHQHPTVPPTDDGQERPGDILGRYKLLERLGEGGFGIVYMAEQREPVRRRVALKIIKPGMDSRQVLGRFETERQALALMDHPHIARVFDAGSSPAGRPFFVMELVRGLPITQFCDDHRLNAHQRLELFIKVCLAIHHAHQKGIVHRDIKPSNVLITLHDDQPVPKVIDFGIAKAMQHDLTDLTVFTRFHEFLGTPAYMSPEQAQLSGLDLDIRTDVYSLGVLLYELLTGNTPFDSRELLSAGYDEMRRRIREVDPPRPSTRLHTLAREERTSVAARRRADPDRLRHQLRGDLDWIVLKCLDKNRSRRYESASALADDLRRHLACEPVIAAAPSATYRAGKFLRRHRLATAASAIVALTLLAATILSTSLALRAIRAERATQALLNKEQRQLREVLAFRRLADEEAERARAETDIASAVTRFLTDDLLGAANPDQNPERELTFRAVLDRASHQWNGRRTNHPLVAATLHRSLAGAYQNLGLHDAATNHYERAWSGYLNTRGASHPDTLAVAIEFAWSLHRQGAFTRALELAEQTTSAATNSLGNTHPVSIKAMGRLAWIYYQSRRGQDAQQLAEQAYLASSTTPDVHDNDLLSIMYLVGRYRGSARGGHFEAGEQILLQAVQWMRERRGDDHLLTARAKNGLAAFYLDHRRHLESAERLFHECLHTTRRVLGEDHRMSLLTRGNLGLLYHFTDRPTASQYHYLKVLEWLPGDARPMELLPGQLQAAPLQTLPISHWRQLTHEPSARWTLPDFDDTPWPTANPPNPSETPQSWWRADLTLDERPTDPLVLILPATGTFEVFINGQPATAGFGTTTAGFQIAVTHHRIIPTLRPGRNTLAIHGSHLEPNTSVPLSVHPFPNPSPAQRGILP
jgi:tRNA A-37 threonylcarbamoyl transferase component Bud32/tetratricopeptide (TPR) repeat protein